MSCVRNKNYQVGKLHQKHYKSSFLIIVIYHYLSLVSQLSVKYVCCSSVTDVLLLHVCHSHSDDVIPIPIPISSPEAHGILMGISISMHTSTLYVAVNENAFLEIKNRTTGSCSVLNTLKSEIADFVPIIARSASGLTPSEKNSKKFN